jgi:hypothetical protein
MIATLIVCMDLQPVEVWPSERGECGVARLGLKPIEASLKGLPLRVMQWRKKSDKSRTSQYWR